MGANFWRFVGAYIKTNWNAAIEYRVSLVSQILGMFINDALWVIFWVLYFTKFPVLNGWELQDVLVLWATVTTSFGLVGGLLSNSLRIPLLVVQGQLDYYLALPKDVLVHVLVSQIRLVNLGDLMFGPILLVLMVDLSPLRVLVFVVATLLAALVMLGFFLATGSLVFYLGNSQTLSGQLYNALLHFATYPTPIFSGGVKLILFTVIPAGFVASLPVELVRQAEWAGFAQLAGAAAFFMGLGVLVFRQGLKRYESGNLLIMRS
jgi:ABC-2 type transport system permease protein